MTNALELVGEHWAENGTLISPRLPGIGLINQRGEVGIEECTFFKCKLSGGVPC